MKNIKSNITLSSLSAALRSVPSINNGGCGQAALLMYKYLVARGYKGVRILFLYDTEDFGTCKILNKMALEHGGPIQSCTHVVLSYKNLLFDCKEVHKIELPLNTSCCHVITQPQLEQSMFEPPVGAMYGWNPEFEENGGKVFTAVAEKVEEEIIGYY